MVDRRARLKRIADDTLDAISKGQYTLGSTRHDLSAPTAASKKDTSYYAPDSLLSSWATVTRPDDQTQADISILEVSTLDGARLLSGAPSSPPGGSPRIGVLNFASARKPGGGFLNGAQAQEESIARSSTLYPTLMTRTAQAFYTLHNRDQKGGYYSHAMVYSPGVTVFRTDDGVWTEPVQIDVLTSAAVNAGVARNTLHGRVAGGAVEDKIAAVMRERMARVLYLFERQGVRQLVLGSFGTGVFKNKVDAVAGLWADLLVADGARFRGSFDRVIFAILGRETFVEFRDTFEARRPQRT